MIVASSSSVAGWIWVERGTRPAPLMWAGFSASGTSGSFFAAFRIVRSRLYAFARARGIRRAPIFRYQASTWAAFSSASGMLPSPGTMWLASSSR